MTSSRSSHRAIPCRSSARSTTPSRRASGTVRGAPGSGQFSINRNSPNATAAILKPGNLVKVCYPEIDPGYIFAFFMGPETSTLISSDEEGGEVITIGGDGALSYFDRAIWLSRKYAVPWWPSDLAAPPAGAEGVVRNPGGLITRFFTIDRQRLPHRVHGDSDGGLRRLFRRAPGLLPA